MVAPRRVIVIGDGTAGLSVANKLGFRLQHSPVEITVIGNSPRHYYKPGGLFISLGDRDLKRYSKGTKFLLSSRISHVRAEVTGINQSERYVLTKGGKRHTYDYAVIASGARYCPDKIPGFEGEAKHFYSFNHALELQRYLSKFNEGNLVVGIPDAPVSFSPALVEFTLLADEYMRTAGVREKVQITLFFPGKDPLYAGGVPSYLKAVLSERDIEIVSDFSLNAVSQKNKEILSGSGDSLKYDLLVVPPPHRGQTFAADSGFDNFNDFINVNEKSLQYKEFPEIFVIGDAAHFESGSVPMSGSAAVFQSGVVSERISGELGGLSFAKDYRGEAIHEIFLGDKRGISVHFIDGKVQEGKVAELDFHLKRVGSDSYFSKIVRGMM